MGFSAVIVYSASMWILQLFLLCGCDGADILYRLRQIQATTAFIKSEHPTIFLRSCHRIMEIYIVSPH